MDRRLKVILCLVLALFHLGTLVGALEGHDEELLGSPAGAPSIGAHACGEKELHRNIDLQHHCIACFRAQNSAADASCSVLPVSSEAGVRHYCALSSLPLRRLTFSAPKRGPPRHSPVS